MVSHGVWKSETAAKPTMRLVGRKTSTYVSDELCV